MFQTNPFPPEGALPPQAVRFTELRIEPWPDGRRVRVHLELTPFQQRPNLEARILNHQGDEVASTTIIENMDIKLVFTMHIRSPETTNQFTLLASISYEDIGVVDEGKVVFDLQDIPGEDPQ